MLKEEVRYRCLNDLNVIGDLCKLLDRNITGVTQMLVRNNSNTLLRYDVIEVIKKHTGLEVADILEQNTEK